HKFGKEFNSTGHLQIRPSLRYRLSDKVHIAGFYAIPLGAWKYTGIEVPGESGFGYYNKSLSHAGLDLSVYLKKMFVDLRALIAEGSAFGIDLKAGYELIKKIFVTLNCSYATTGDYTYMEGITNSSRIGVGVTYSMRNFENRAKNRIIFRPDYPMVVVAGKELDGENASEVNPEISLTGTPLTGYAPLDVSFKASHKGFQGDVEMTWFFNTTYFSTSSNKDSAFTYTLPGTYECYVEGRDQFNNFAKSNVVTITVLDIATGDDEFTITSSVTSGTGTIDPDGSTIVKFDEDQKYTMTPADGWHVLKVLCDGKSVGAVTEYIFKKCDKDHTISVEFTETAPTTHTITVSVKNNLYGSISPGTTQVEHGSDISFIFTPEDNNKHAIRYWVNGQQFNDEGIAEYSFKNVTSDQTLEVEFDWIYYDVKVTLSLADNETYGHVDPGTGTFTYKKGSDLTFNFIKDHQGTMIDKVIVNGNNKGSVETFKIYEITQDEFIDVYMKRRSVPVDAIIDGNGCDCIITSSIGQSGTGTYNLLYGDSITFYFDPQNTSQTYWLGVQDNGHWSVIELPSSYTFSNVTGDNNYFRIKCADPGDPPPF
ncbi:MAG: hypothetical protein KAR14_07790, partial [Candidatus Aminicenantes bacterium]|nr:hypothetical protein [Candidatus Aminicenantes bacterium]